MPFKILYHEDALEDLKKIFYWSLDNHPDTTNRFASEFFNHLDLAEDYPQIGVPLRSEPGVRRLFTRL